MKALKFTLSGQNAFFKKPEVNTYCYFTFGQIHKVVLLGMFGAILGYDGYEKKTESAYPEFYERLKDLSISIVPRNEKGYISKKVQYFNNSVGYASKEQGGNLIVKEQWLENPIWDIYILLNCEEAMNLAQSIKEKKCVYIPYLGKNDHPADLRDAEIVELIESQESEVVFHCLFPKEIGTLCFPEEEDDLQEFKYEEELPVALDAETNLYRYQSFQYTNLTVAIKDQKVFNANGKFLSFY